MYKALTAFMLFGLLMLTACPGGSGGESGDSGNATGDDSTTVADATDMMDEAADAVESGADMVEAVIDPVERGREIYYGTDYSNTGLTCAHCHAASPEEEANGKLIAHTGYGAMPRGSWKHTSQEMLDAGEGRAATIVDAANACVKAAYMDHGEQLIEGTDGEALTAFMESIADETAWDAEPFVIEVNRSMPVGGLTPDMENGERIYENTCEGCHEAGIDGLVDLHGLGEWMNTMQLMAKIRKLDDWYGAYENAEYATLPSHNLDRAVAWMLGSTVAHAQEGNPCGDNPCGDHSHESHEGHDHGDSPFSEDAMPFFASDILSDQDVVDVAHYIIENE